MKFLAIIEVTEENTILRLDKDETVIDTGGMALSQGLLKEMASFVKNPRQQAQQVIDMWKRMNP